jgi:hypothetical protein
VHAELNRCSLAAKPDMLSYSRRGLGPKPEVNNPDKRYLLDLQEDRAREGVFQVPGSLREVEQGVRMYLLDEVTVGVEDD